MVNPTLSPGFAQDGAILSSLAASGLAASRPFTYRAKCPILLFSLYQASDGKT